MVIITSLPLLSRKFYGTHFKMSRIGSPDHWQNPPPRRRSGIWLQVQYASVPPTHCSKTTHQCRVIPFYFCNGFHSSKANAYFLVIKMLVWCRVHINQQIKSTLIQLQLHTKDTLKACKYCRVYNSLVQSDECRLYAGCQPRNVHTQSYLRLIMFLH